MKEFFRGWRRKVGLGLLVLSLLAWFSWMRSLYVEDDITICNYGLVCSGGGRLLWGSTNQSSQCLFHHRSYIASDSEGELWMSMDSEQEESFADWERQAKFDGDLFVRDWSFRTAGFASGVMKYRDLVVRIWIVPYWSLVIPLTVLSSYLLLGMPRKRN